jgi:hypothetical protein
MDDSPTELTIEDVNKFLHELLNGDFDLKPRPCFKCSKEFFPNYDLTECDECFFSQFNKKDVEAFCKSFFD